MVQPQLAPILIKGYKFFNSETKENVLIKGVDYYPRPNTGELDKNNVDFFTEEYRHVWERDIPQFQELGINAIRLYSVDPQYDHSAFMCALNEAGIYAMVELASGDCPTCAVLSSKAPTCYSPHLKIRGQEIMREFSKYSNTLAFSAGNEVNHFVPLGKGPEWNAPCLKKFVRDMRHYARKCDGMRHVPIGLIEADTDRHDNTMYYNCQHDGDDDLSHAEWYGINTYVYCDANNTSFENTTGFKTLSQDFGSYNYSIPVLMTEFGCLSESFPTIDGYEAQRSFNQAKWLGLPELQENFAGGFTFEYSIESSLAKTPFPFKEFGEQNYGVGYLSPEDCDDVNIMCEYKRTPSFYNLKESFALAKVDAIFLDDFEPEESRIGRTKCPSGFPPLHKFKWQSDYKIDAWCPKRHELSFTCPNLAIGEIKSAHSIPTSLITFVNFIGIVIMILYFVSSKILKKEKPEKVLFQGKVYDYTSDEKSSATEESTEDTRLLVEGDNICYSVDSVNIRV